MIPELRIEGTRVFQAIAIKHGMRALLNGFKVNTSYTRKNCLAMTTKFTGQTYGRGDTELQRAVTELDALIKIAKLYRDEATVVHVG